MRVAITHTRYTPRGGVEGYVHALVRQLLDAGHEVHVFCHFWDEKAADARAHLHRIPYRWKQVKFMKVWAYDRWVTRHVRRGSFDVVHGFSKSSVQDIYTDGSGCLADYQTYSIDQAASPGLRASLKRKSFHQRIVRSIEARRFTRGNFGKVVVMSDLVGDQIKRRYGLNDDEVVTVYNGIDTERFNPANREEYRLEYQDRIVVPQGTFVVLCVANDFRRKGVDTLVEAAKLLKDRGLPGGRAFRFAVVGHETQALEQALSERAKRLGVWNDIKFYGPQERTERWYALSDAFVLPTRFDAFGQVVLEAMASGVPPIVSRKAGAAELVYEGKNGFVLEDPEDPEAVAEYVTRMAGDEDERRKLGEAAREEALLHRWPKHFERILELYEEVAASKSAGARVGRA